MHKFVRNLITEWRRLQLPFEGETLVVAVSGGADSVSLLLGLHDLTKRKKLKHRLVMAHFDHGLRGAASVGDSEFVRSLAEDLGHEFVTEKGRLRSSGNVEQVARDARYAFLNKTAESHSAFAILTAHTMNDQAETFLMNLIRGSGPDGLGAMAAVRYIDGSRVKLIRPFLRECKREETEAYCREAGIEFRHDAMNDDPRFTRVRIRKEVLPLLASLNPKIIEALARTADHFQMKTRSNESERHSAVEIASFASSETLAIKDLLPLDENARLAAIHSWLGRHRGNTRGLTLKHILAVAELLVSRKSGRMVELPGRAVVVKRGGSLYYSNVKVEK
ncbi:hypothetical protein BH24ACI3_BH24ACI3_03290 [soil metagenome]